MSFLNDKKRKYLVLLPIAFLLFNALYFQYAAGKIGEVMLREKQVEIEDMVNMLADAIEVNAATGGRRNEHFIVSSMESIDRIYRVYGEAYRLEPDGSLTLITERFQEPINGREQAFFSPLDHAGFAQAVFAQDSGNMVLLFSPEPDIKHEIHIYFRWMPLLTGAEERYLVVSGVSRYSIVTQIPFWVSAGQWANTAVLFALTVWLVTLIARLGHIYDQRMGEKWRDRRRSDV